MKYNCVSLKRLLNSIYIIKELKYFWNIAIEFVLIFRVCSGLHNNIHCEKSRIFRALYSGIRLGISFIRQYSAIFRRNIVGILVIFGAEYVRIKRTRYSVSEYYQNIFSIKIFNGMRKNKRYR